MKSERALFFTIVLILSIVLANNELEKPVKKTMADSTYANMLIPAVDDKGNGIITNLTVQVKQGEGRSLVDINDLSFWVDTQNSIRTAKDVAQKFTGAKLGNYDIIYSIITNASAVEGPSAGAAIAIATIAALENKTLRHDVLITGTIEPDGSIGKVGDVTQKAAAVKSLNAALFLVPSGQSLPTAIGYEKACKIYFVSKICSSQWMTRSINLEKTAGISVAEVKDITDAMTYMVMP